MARQHNTPVGKFVPFRQGLGELALVVEDGRQDSTLNVQLQKQLHEQQ